MVNCSSSGDHFSTSHCPMLYLKNWDAVIWRVEPALAVHLTGGINQCTLNGISSHTVLAGPWQGESAHTNGITYHPTQSWPWQWESVHTNGTSSSHSVVIGQRCTIVPRHWNPLLPWLTYREETLHRLTDTLHIALVFCDWLWPHR